MDGPPAAAYPFGDLAPVSNGVNPGPEWMKCVFAQKSIAACGPNDAYVQRLQTLNEIDAAAATFGQVGSSFFTYALADGTRTCVFLRNITILTQLARTANKLTHVL